jgi:hypothetical protein
MRAFEKDTSVIAKPTKPEKASKRCRKCGEKKPIAQFPRRTGTRYGQRRQGHRATCAACRNDVQRQWRQEHPEAFRAQLIRYQEGHPEKIKGIKKKSAKKTYYADLPKARHKGAKAAKQFRDANPGYSTVYSHRRRARQVNAPGSHTKEEADAKLASQNNRCANPYCRAVVLHQISLLTGKIRCHLEHKIPLARGGSNDIENICFTCDDCNLSKSSKTWDEFMELQKRLHKRKKAA